MGLGGLVQNLYEKAKSQYQKVSRFGKATLVSGLIGAVAACGGGSSGGSNTSSSSISSTMPNANFVLRFEDANTNPVSGVAVSVYDSADYDIETAPDSQGPPEAKPIPDVITDQNGLVSVAIPQNGRINVVASYQGTITRIFSLNLGQKLTKPALDQKVDQMFFAPNDPDWNSPLSNGDGNINFFGHIKHDQEYAQAGNIFVPGESVPLLEKWVNNSNAAATGSFKILRDLPGPNDPIMYTGNLGDANEAITANANGKGSKLIPWYIDPAIINTWGFGKCKAVAYWLENGQEKTHPLGEFFVTPDTTPPTLNASAAFARYDNETLQIIISYQDTPQAGTVRSTFLDIQSVDSANVWIKTDTDTSSGPNSPFDSDVQSLGSPITLPARGEVTSPAADVGKSAKLYTINLWVQDSNGNVASWSATDKNYLTQTEAGLRTDKHFDDFKMGPTWSINYAPDVTLTSGHGWDFLTNRYNSDYGVGLNYALYGGLSPANATHLDNDRASNNHLPHIIVIPQSTLNDFDNDIINKLLVERDVHGHAPPP